MANFIDKLFRDKLQNRQFSPETGDWAAMNELLNSDLGAAPSSAFSINWMFLSVASVLFSISIYAGISANDVEMNTISHSADIEEGYKKPVELNKQAFQSNSTVSISKTKQSNIASSTYLSNQKAKNTNQSNTIIGLKTARESENELAFTHEGKSENSSKTIEENSASYSSLNSLGLEKDESTYQAAFSTGANTNKPSTDLFEKEKQVKSNTKSPTQQKGNSATKTLAISKNKNDNKYPPTSSDYTRRSFNKSTFEQKEILFLSSQSVQFLEINSEKAILQDLSHETPSIAKATSTKAKRSLPLQFSVAAFGEVSYVMKGLKGESEYQSLIETRNAQEKNIFSYGAGLEFQAKYKQIGFSTGLSLQNWGENIQYEEKYNSEWDVSSSTISDTIWDTDIVFEYDTVWSPIDSAFVFIIVDSSFISVIDSVYTITEYDSTETVTELGLAMQNGKSKISYWEIPLYFSYQFDIGDFYLSPGIGVTIGFLKITQGHYLSIDQQSLIPINTDYAIIRKTLFNGQLNLGVGYKLNDKFSLEATPVFRFNLSNIFENPEMIQKYSSLAIQFRFRYYF